MNFRNRKLLITLRTILGLFLIFSGVSGFLAAGQSMEGVPPAMVAMTQSLWAMGIFQMIKVTEIVVGLMFVAGFLPALANLALAPICIGILVFNARISPGNLPFGIIVTLFSVYFGYAYWDKYKQLFQRA